MALISEDFEEKKPETRLDKFIRMYRDSQDQLSDARQLAFRDREFTDNFCDSQWTDDEKRVMQKRGQPVVTSNRIKRKVNFLRGMEQRTRTDPKAFPRRPEMEEYASIASDVLDFIETNTRFDRKASRAFEDLAVEGIEAVEITWNGREIEVHSISYDRFFYDPHSELDDFSDANYLGYVEWFDLFDAINLFEDFEGSEEALRGSLELSRGRDDGYEDKPYVKFGDPSRNRVMVIMVYYRSEEDGQWQQAIFTGGGVIIDQESPYVSDNDDPESGIVAQSLYVSRDNERFGVVRDMIPLQREINMRRSLALHLLKNKRLWQAHKGVFQNPAKAREQMARADGILEANGAFQQEWGFLESVSEIQGNLELMQEAKAELDLQGPNAGLQGRGVERQSGKAILAQQESGLTEENQLFDSHNDWKLRCYRTMWNRARQFWTQERTLRITDRDPASAGFRFVTVNTTRPQPITGPLGTQIGEVESNTLKDMDMDITMQLTPDFLSQQHETFEMMAELAGRGGDITPTALLLMAPHFHNKDKVMEQMQRDKEQQFKLLEAQQKTAAALAEQEVANKRADTRKKGSEAQLNTAKAAEILAPDEVRETAET